MLIIVRGLPGSGKTTFAKETFPTTMLLEAGMLCMRNGEYVFSRAALKTRHAMIRRIVQAVVEHGADVVVTGTMTRRWEVLQYAEMTPAHIVYRCIGRYKDIHGVPEETLQDMRRAWEAFPGEKTVWT